MHTLRFPGDSKTLHHLAHIKQNIAKEILAYGCSFLCALYNSERLPIRSRICICCFPPFIRTLTKPFLPDKGLENFNITLKVDNTI